MSTLGVGSRMRECRMPAKFSSAPGSPQTPVSVSCAGTGYNGVAEVVCWIVLLVAVKSCLLILLVLCLCRTITSTRNHVLGSFPIIINCTSHCVQWSFTYIHIEFQPQTTVWCAQEWLVVIESVLRPLQDLFCMVGLLPLF